MISDFFFEGSKEIFEVTSTPKNATIASATWAHLHVSNELNAGQYSNNQAIVTT